MDRNPIAGICYICGRPIRQSLLGRGRCLNVRACRARRKTGPRVCWKVTLSDTDCYAFATTRDRAKWFVVRSYWDAYGRTGAWPQTTVLRAAEFDHLEHRFGNQAYSLDALKIV